jgi:hypothetical protein
VQEICIRAEGLDVKMGGVVSGIGLAADLRPNRIKVSNPG